jgi:8-oxo-dGTP pyrophosphatase MutT (NUDIX family)
MITPFGGKREEGEDHITCLKRELLEELELDLDETDWRYVTKIPGARNDGSFLQIFYVKIKSSTKLTCHEGSLIKLTQDELNTDSRITDYLKNVYQII